MNWSEYPSIFISSLILILLTSWTCWITCFAAFCYFSKQNYFFYVDELDDLNSFFFFLHLLFFFAVDN